MAKEGTRVAEIGWRRSVASDDAPLGVPALRWKRGAAVRPHGPLSARDSADPCRFQRLLPRRSALSGNLFSNNNGCRGRPHPGYCGQYTTKPVRWLRGTLHWQAEEFPTIALFDSHKGPNMEHLASAKVRARRGGFRCIAFGPPRPLAMFA